MKTFYFKSFPLYLTILLLIPNLMTGQDVVNGKMNRFGIKVGFSSLFPQIKEDPLSGGRGLGCSMSHSLEIPKTIQGVKLGFFYEHKLKQKTSLIFGHEILFLGKNNLDYYTSYGCINGERSHTDGYVKYPTVSMNFLFLGRQEIPVFDMFFEIGGYHDLGATFRPTYVYEQTDLRNYMGQLYPEPILTNGQKKLLSSNYGLIFGIGNSTLSILKKIEIKCQYYLGFSEVIVLGEYKHLSLSGFDLSASFRF